MGLTKARPDCIPITGIRYTMCILIHMGCRYYDMCLSSNVEGEFWSGHEGIWCCPYQANASAWYWYMYLVYEWTQGTLSSSIRTRRQRYRASLQRVINSHYKYLAWPLHSVSSSPPSFTARVRIPRSVAFSESHACQNGTWWPELATPGFCEWIGGASGNTVPQAHFDWFLQGETPNRVGQLSCLSLLLTVFTTRCYWHWQTRGNLGPTRAPSFCHDP